MSIELIKRGERIYWKSRTLMRRGDHFTFTTNSTLTAASNVPRVNYQSPDVDCLRERIKQLESDNARLTLDGHDWKSGYTKKVNRIIELEQQNESLKSQLSDLSGIRKKYKDSINNNHELRKHVTRQKQDIKSLYQQLDGWSESYKILLEKARPGTKEFNKAAHRVVRSYIAYEKAHSEAMENEEHWHHVTDMYSEIETNLAAYKLLANQEG
jgi:predicted RNase H-like nuclease (RuvC/YqgF family)